MPYSTTTAPVLNPYPPAYGAPTELTHPRPEAYPHTHTHPPLPHSQTYALPTTTTPSYPTHPTHPTHPTQTQPYTHSSTLPQYSYPTQHHCKFKHSLFFISKSSILLLIHESQSIFL